MKARRTILSILCGVALSIGILQIAYADDNVAYADVPVHRLYMPSNGEHLYTSDANEAEVLSNNAGWLYEGIGWYAPTGGQPVYRLNNDGLKNHLYTTDTNEVHVLTTQDVWTLDNGGRPLFYSGGNVNIYRVYNEGLNGMHHLTTDANEYNTLPSYGWKQEGSKIGASRIGDASKTITVKTGSHSSVVYVTRTGYAYHRGSCPTIQNSTGLRMFSPSELSGRYTPCKVCKP